MKKLITILILLICYFHNIVAEVKMIQYDGIPNGLLKELPEAIINAVMLFAKENPQYEKYFENKLDNNSIIDAARINDKYYDLSSTFHEYTIVLKHDTENNLYIRILLNKEKNEAYILNEGYDISKISIFIKSQMGNLQQIIERRNLGDLADVIMNQYSVYSSISSGVEVAAYMGIIEDAPLKFRDDIKLLTVTRDELKAKAYWPEFVLCSDMKSWKYKFLSLMSNGSILEVFVDGNLTDDNYLEIKKITHKVIFPKRSIRIPWIIS